MRVGGEERGALRERTRRSPRQQGRAPLSLPAAPAPARLSGSPFLGSANTRPRWVRVRSHLWRDFPAPLFLVLSPPPQAPAPAKLAAPGKRLPQRAFGPKAESGRCPATKLVLSRGSAQSRWFSAGSGNICGSCSWRTRRPRRDVPAADDCMTTGRLRIWAMKPAQVCTGVQRARPPCPPRLSGSHGLAQERCW